jgi:DNA-binding transcriptional regulator YdaS (Cro superfamily)
MKLKDFLALQHPPMSQTAFAALIDVKPQLVSRYLKGTIPDRERMRRIREATDGQVTADDFYVEPGEASDAAA